jgi:hypothetical protein
MINLEVRATVNQQLTAASGEVHGEKLQAPDFQSGEAGFQTRVNVLA